MGAKPMSVDYIVFFECDGQTLALQLTPGSVEWCFSD
jgi:hypothetical protein